MKELGFPQDSLFYWQYSDSPLPDSERWQIKLKREISGEDWEMYDGEIFSAYTCSELGDMLKEYSENMPHYVRGQECWAKAVDKGENNDFEFVESDTEVDCRAKMLIYLKEHNLI